MSRTPKALKLATLLLLFASGVSILPVSLPGIVQPVQAQTTEAQKAEAERLLNLCGGDDSIDAEKGIQLCQQAVAAYQQLKDPVIEGFAKIYLGLFHLKLRNFDQAIVEFQSALELGRKTGERRLEALALNSLGLAYYGQGKSQQAREYFQQALPLARELKDSQFEENIQQALSQIEQQEIQQLQTSQLPIEQSQQLPEKIEPEKLLNLCREHLSQNLAGAAIQSCQQAIVAYQQIGDRSGEAKATVNLGIAYDLANQSEQAVTTWKSALELAKLAGDRQVEAIALYALGGMYGVQGKSQQATEFLQQALTVAREINDSELEEAIQKNLLQSPEKAEAERLFYEGDQQFRANQVSEALRSFETALKLYREIGDNKGEAHTLGNMGNAYFSQGEHQKAIEFYQQSLTISQKIRDRDGEAIALNNLAFAFSFLEKYPEAIEYYQQSLSIAKEIKNRELVVYALTNLASTYTSLGQYQEMIYFYQQSLSIAREIKDKKMEVTILGFLEYGLRFLRKYEKAIEYSQQSLSIAREIEDRYQEVRALNNLALAYNFLGQYQKAIEFNKQSLDLATAISSESGEAVALDTKGSIYVSLGQYKKAIESHKQSIDLAKEARDEETQANALGNLGSSYFLLGDWEKALEYQKQSLALSRKNRDRKGEAVSLQNQGKAYLFLGQYQKAIENFQQSLTITRKIGDRAGEGIILQSLGVAYFFSDQFQKAIEFFQQSLDPIREVDDRATEVKSLDGIGFTSLFLKQYPQAESVLFRAIEIQETLRQNLTDSDQVSLFEIQKNSYVLLQHTLVEQNKTNQALEISERGRARAFVELLALRQSENSNQPLTIQPPTIKQIQQIARDQKATLVEYSLAGETIYIWVIKPTGEVKFHPVDLSNLDTPLENLTNETLRELISQADSSNQNSRQANEPITRSDSQSAAYAPGDWVTLKDDAERGFQEPWQVVQFDEAQNMLTLTHPTFAEGTPPRPRSTRDVLKKEKSYRANYKNLQKLHQLLIDPIADLLPKNPDERVIFIPHHVLFFVPFAALQDSQGTYLIDKHTILTAPAIQVLELTRQQKNARFRDNAGQALVVGNPTMPTIPLIDPPTPLASLPGAEEEAKEVAQLLDTQPILGKEATKARIVSQMEKASIIHLATHGLLNDIKQLGTPGAIALAPTDEKSDPYNGFLTSGEIFTMKLNADLVVLSACNTGQGNITGDGVIGLSRSFMKAGVPSIVVSLWKVSDEATAKLMTDFYQNQKTTNKAQALRNAMLATKEQYPQPGQWAAFTLMGEAE